MSRSFVSYLRYVLPAAIAAAAAPACAGPDEEAALSRLALGCQTCPTAQIFEPGNLSLPDKEEWRITFTPDGDEAYFGRSDEFFPISRQSTIYVSHRVGDSWTTPEVAPFSGVYSDIDPFVSPDGKKLYFSSIRPVDGVDRADADLWMVKRLAGGAWSEPIHLGPLVNSPADELYPTVTSGGTLYFGSDRAGGFGGWDIWRSKRQGGVYQAAENLGPGVNSDLWEFNPWISPSGKTLVFASLFRPEGYGYGDLYVSFRHDGEFQPAANLGPCVNSEADEYHPAPTPQLGSLFFIRHHYEPTWIPGEIMEISIPD